MDSAPAVEPRADTLEIPVERPMLYLVPTPLGNLGDITLRSLATLKQVDLVAAEDTRQTGKLLHLLGLSRPLLSLHDHNESSRAGEIVRRLQNGEAIALVSDAGMPLLSDPGYRVVRACLEAKLPLTALPGPSAIPTALAASGLPPLPFFFGGFLPVKSGRRENEFRTALARACTSIYFESPHRLLKSLATLSSLAPSSQVCVAREISKKFEDYQRGTAATVNAHFQARPPKGEITLLLHPGIPDRTHSES
jgi:16S rRNA (cytidine1402-2'-O)-methyltransferase